LISGVYQAPTVAEPPTPGKKIKLRFSPPEQISDYAPGKEP